MTAAADTNPAPAGTTKTAGAFKAGDGAYLFDLANLDKIDAGTGYSSAHGSVVEGERIQVGLINKARGTGARPHSHPNEQWNYVIKGQLRVFIEGEEERIVGPGTLIYFPANKVHSTVALPDEDVVFFVVKDLSHGIIGMAADGSMAGPHYDEGFAPKA
ncbi:cupin domain-containing protein [Methylobrevis albus]|uniref:Cupin domain-containing protein n=1 Tax=Methylobrevis albus TaxID=2793297 RepID=A0A931I3I9_9HYPH|nr:cupin domain-containing protein [Methylobrevis albus]MBH0238799.1 cupin domain-containing protein [Methylobrevis albus]